MKNELSCPFLGTPGDKEVSFLFPNTQNTCFKAKYPAQINPFYQKKYCLSEDFTQCGIFLKKNPYFIPKNIKLPHNLIGIKVFTIFAIIIISVITLFLSYPSKIIFQNNFIPSEIGTSIPYQKFTNTIEPTLEKISTKVIATSTLIQDNAVSTIIPTIQPSPTDGPYIGTPFGPENIFLLHRVAPGESYLFLANVYGTTANAIITLNAKSKADVLLFDQILVIIPGILDSSNFPQFKVVFVDNEIELTELSSTHNISISELMYYNSLGNGTQSVPSGKWLIIPIK